MTMYNLTNRGGLEPFLIAPMLGGCPEKMFPRFRDCFLQERGFELVKGRPVVRPKNNALEEGIYIFTRVGGGNREDYRTEIDNLRAHADYIRDFDDSFDSTYATFVFRVPTEWQQDYSLIAAGKLTKTTE